MVPETFCMMVAMLNAVLAFALQHLCQLAHVNESRVSNGVSDSGTATTGPSLASNALTQAYRQPSKIPRLASSSSISQQPVRQGSRGTKSKLCFEVAYSIDLS